MFDASNGMADNSVQTIKCTKTGRMVISSIGHINFYEGMSFMHINPVSQGIYTLPKYDGHYRLCFDKFHHLWLKDKHQVTCLDLLTERFVADVQGVIRQMGVDKTIDDLFADNDNHIWFLVDKTLHCQELGLALPVVSDKSALHDVQIYKDSLLLQFYADGLVSAVRLKDGGHAFDVPAATSEEAESYSRSSVVTVYGSNFLQIRNGDHSGQLRRFDVEKRQWSQLMAQPYHLNNIAIRDDRIYIAARYGYWVYDDKTGDSVHFPVLNLSKGRKLATDVNAIEFDRQGGMWLGTETRGLLYSKPYTSPIHVYSLTSTEGQHYKRLMDAQLGEQPLYARPVNCIYHDSRGWKWTGHYSGLKLEKKEGGEPRYFGRKDGLVNQMVRAVVEDNQHDIWISTSYGISHLFVKDNDVNRVETYINSDNVPTEAFVSGKAAKLDDGTIVMQSIDHVVVFNPANFHSMNEYVLYPKLIQLDINGQQIEAGTEVDGKVILERDITRTAEFSVNYLQNTLMLTFSGLNFFRPLQTYYRIRVRGVRQFDDWRILSHASSPGLVDKYGMLKLLLMGLQPGQYKVELQASMTPDHWPQDPFVWTINVNEPWWRSTGIYVLLFFLLVLVLVVNAMLYMRNTRLRLERYNGESDIINRVKTCVRRCNEISTEVLSPTTVMSGRGEQMTVEHLEEYADVMSRVVPYVNSLCGGSFSIGDLARLVGMDKKQLYVLLAENLDKNPRLLAMRLRLYKAASMLQSTDLSVEEIAEQCHFASANYFIASFYHRYRQTPADYRNMAAR